MKILKILFICVIVWAVPTYSFAQRKVTGQVLDDNKAPIPGATVFAEGMPSEITSTDENGRFQLTTTKPVLTVTYIGFKNQRIVIGDKAEFTITLQTDDQNLDEVIVVAYGKQSKRNITGAVSNILSLIHI